MIGLLWLWTVIFLFFFSVCSCDLFAASIFFSFFFPHIFYFFCVIHEFTVSWRQRCKNKSGTFFHISQAELLEMPELTLEQLSGDTTIILLSPRSEQLAINTSTLAINLVNKYYDRNVNL
jgi:hypothetical protein